MKDGKPKFLPRISLLFFFMHFMSFMVKLLFFVSFVLFVVLYR
jgi:hypothetical protein